jgi:flotillin
MITVLAVVAVVFVVTLLFLKTRLKKCPADKIMVVYGKLPNGAASICIHGGTKFIWPFIQAYQFLDLTPISIDIDLKKALDVQNERFDLTAVFTAAISTEPGVMQNAAERLLGLRTEEIQNLAKDIIFGQLRLTIASMYVGEIVADRDKFLETVFENAENELKKIGLKLINVNITDVSDESGYIDALGREAAEKNVGILVKEEVAKAVGVLVKDEIKKAIGELVKDEVEKNVERSRKG